MKKTATVLSVISMVLIGLALLIAVVSLTVFWKPLSLQFHSIPEAIGIGPVLQVGIVINMLGTLLVALVLLITSQFKKTVIIEIIAIVALCLLLPVLTSILGVVQSSWVGAQYGSSFLVAQSVTINILALPRQLVGLASSLCLVTCGMRIAEAVYEKKQSRV